MQMFAVYSTVSYATIIPYMAHVCLCTILLYAIAIFSLLPLSSVSLLQVFGMISRTIFCKSKPVVELMSFPLNFAVQNAGKPQFEWIFPIFSIILPMCHFNLPSLAICLGIPKIGHRPSVTHVTLAQASLGQVHLEPQLRGRSDLRHRLQRPER